MNNKRFYHINSSTKLSGTSSAFSYFLEIPQNGDYDRITVSMLNIPVSYYLIPNNYNTFILNEQGTDITITIPPGNYNLSSFCYVVSSLMTNNSQNGFIYNMTFNNGYNNNLDGKIYYSVSNNSDIQPSIILLKSNYLYEQFGFYPGTYTFSSNILKSDNVCNFVQESTLFLHSDLVTGSNNDILQAIYQSNNSTMSFITYISPDLIGFSKQLMTNKNNIANFYITDKNNHLIDLNGQEVEISILLYSSDKTNNIIKNIFDLIKTFLEYIIKS